MIDKQLTFLAFHFSSFLITSTILLHKTKSLQISLSLFFIHQQPQSLRISSRSTHSLLKHILPYTQHPPNLNNNTLVTRNAFLPENRPRPGLCCYCLLRSNQRWSDPAAHFCCDPSRRQANYRWPDSASDIHFCCDPSRRQANYRRPDSASDIHSSCCACPGQANHRWSSPASHPNRNTRHQANHRWPDPASRLS